MIKTIELSEMTRTFSDRTPSIELPIDGMCDGFNVVLRGGDDFMKLPIIVDAINRVSPNMMAYSTLFMPYVYGARMDRVMATGWPLTVKVYADIVNSLMFNEVILFDAHSDVSPALIENSRNLNNHNFIRNVLIEEGYFNEPCEVLIASPDAGAIKKVYNLTKKLSFWYPDHEFKVIECSKVRDVKTGELISFNVLSKGVMDGRSPVLIVDDICDGGGTFIGLAKELKKNGAGELTLAVSHGIFSKSIGQLNSVFSNIYTTDSFLRKSNPLIKTIPYDR